MTSSASSRTGILIGVTAYCLWGLLPLYIHALQPMTATSILTLRLLATLAFLLLLTALLRRGGHVMSVARQPRLLGLLTISSLLIATNWLTYIYAIGSHQLVQASFGLFINPLLNIALGVLILRERLNIAEWAAIALAIAGVAVFGIDQHGVPILSMILAVSFAIYGLVRKMVPVDPIEGLLIETMILLPAAALWLLGHPSDAQVPSHLWALVAFSGVVTATPMLLFMAAAKRVRYSDLALLQYIAPTLQLLQAVLLFGEPLRPIHLIAFGFIWLGLLVYGWATWRRGQAEPVTLPE